MVLRKADWTRLFGSLKLLPLEPVWETFPAKPAQQQDYRLCDHIRTLHNFGTSLKIGTSDYLTPCDLSFGIEMARHESKGGIVVVLQQPHYSQDNSDGFLASKRNCLFVKAVSELIHATSNARFGL